MARSRRHPLPPLRQRSVQTFSSSPETLLRRYSGPGGRSLDVLEEAGAVVTAGRDGGSSSIGREALEGWDTSGSTGQRKALGKGWIGANSPVTWRNDEGVREVWTHDPRRRRSSRE